MNQAWRIGILDVRLLLSDPGAIVQMLVFPILFTWVFGLSFGGGSNQPQALPLIVDNRDAGPLGQTLVNWLPASDVRVLDPADSPGDTPNFRLVIPDDFTTSVVDHPPGHVELIVPPKTSALRVQSLKVAFTQAQIRTLATLTRTRPESATAWEDPDFVAQWTGAINEPLLVRTEVETATRRETPPSGMDQQLPGNIVMFVVMTLLVNSAVHLTSERKNGAFRRLMASPLTPGRILAGKLLGRIVPATVQVALLFLTGRILFGVHIGSALPGIILLSGAFILCAAAMGLTMGMWMDDRNHVVAAGVPLTLGMAALGGCWWPIEIVGPFMQRLGMTLPTGWAMRGYHELLSFGYGITAVLDNSALLIAAAFVFTAIAARRIRPVR